MRALAYLAAVTLAVSPVVAQAAEQPCLTAAEFNSLASYALPSLITGTTERCGQTLPADAWLRRNGSDLAARYTTRKSAGWPAAKAAFLKFGGTSGNAEANNLLRSLPDASLQPIFDTVIAGLVSQKMPTERCGTVDRVLRLLSPLPPENTAELIALVVGLGAKSGGTKVGAFSLCPA